MLHIFCSKAHQGKITKAFEAKNLYSTLQDSKLPLNPPFVELKG